jgi:hypothetical protein
MRETEGVQRWGFVVDRWTLAEDLWRWGEDALATEVLAISDDTLFSIWLAAGDLARRGDQPSRSVAWGVAAAAVQVIEGQERPLARRRRRPKTELPDFGGTVDERVASVSELIRRGWPEA